MVGIDKKCVASCPQSYAISVAGDKISCVQRCPLHDLRYVCGTANNEKVHRCVGAAELKNFKYYRKMNDENDTRLAVEACDENEFEGLQYVEFPESKSRLTECVKECDYVKGNSCI